MNIPRSPFDEPLRGVPADVSSQGLSRFLGASATSWAYSRCRNIATKGKKYSAEFSHDGRPRDGLAVKDPASPADRTAEAYLQLRGKCDQKILTPNEHAELLDLTEEVERHDANRVQALAELAALRKTTLAQVMSELERQVPVRPR
jgi:hypothetical protein